MTYTVEYPWAVWTADGGSFSPSVAPTTSGWVYNGGGLARIRHNTLANVPAGPVTTTMAEASANPAGGQVYMNLYGNGVSLFPSLIDAGGGDIVGGYGAVRINAGMGTINPVWMHPGGPLTTLIRGGIERFDTLFSGPKTDLPGSAPVGVRRLWDRVALETTTLKAPPLPSISSNGAGITGFQGPWITSDASGSTLVVSASLGAVASTVTIPIQADSTNVTVRLTGTPSPVLVSAGGGIDNGDGTVTVTAGNRRNIVWSGCSGTVKLTMAKGLATGVISYSPFYVDTPPPAPPLPAIAALIPTAGPDTGGINVDVIGTDFTGATAINFGSTPGTSLSVVTDGYATVTSPAHAVGAVDVTITTPDGTSAPETFTFEAPGAPTLTGIDPTSGTAAGGTPVLLTGTDLAGTTGVTFGGTPATITTVTDAALLVTTPAHPAGTVDVTATTPDGTTDPLAFEYVPVPGPHSVWSWVVADALLDAAVGCGATCDRRFVSTDPSPEGPPPGSCPCQLVAAITRDGYRQVKGSPARYRQAEIVLTLHQCTPVPGADETVDPTRESTFARDQATTRDLMMRGIRQASKTPGGPVGLCQSSGKTDGWVHIATTGGMSKWTMTVTVE